MMIDRCKLISSERCGGIKFPKCLEACLVILQWILASTGSQCTSTFSFLLFLFQKGVQ